MTKIKETIKRLEDVKEHFISVQKIDEYTDFESYIRAVDTAIEVLGKMPTIETEPVRRGRWITREMTIDSGCTSCSCCHSEYYIGDLLALEGDNDFVMFCPNCGAKMEEEEQ